MRRMILDSPGCRKVIDAIAQSRWSFQGSAAQSSDVCEMEYATDRGRFLRSLVNRGVSETMFTEKPIVMHASGMHFNRVCYACNLIGLKKACLSESCNSIYFCSRECVRAASGFLDVYGGLVDDVTNTIHPSYKDQALLLIRILYANISSPEFDISNVFSMELCRSSKDPDLSAAAVA